MICITVTPTSRTLAPADLLNASRQCDLIELCLDHFIAEPNVGDLLRVVDKPILVSCRNARDGGQWKGSEHERIQLLREAIVAGPEWVELDLEAAKSIPRYGQTKRLVSYSSLNRPLSRIDEIFQQCRDAKADAVKFTWLTEDLDATWPLLAAVTQPRDLPIVGIGVGQSGLTFSLLGRKYGSPWIYAALERGMESFDNQPTVWQLKEDYHWDEITGQTRFLGIVGCGVSEKITARVFNAAFQEMEKPIRCLPLLPGTVEKLPGMLKKLKINALIVDPVWRGDLSSMHSVNTTPETTAGRPDVLMETVHGWKGVGTACQAIDIAGRAMTGAQDWAERGAVTVLGGSTTALDLARFFAGKGAAVSVAGFSDNSAATIARKAGVRHVPWNAVFDLRADTLVIADFGTVCGMDKGQLNPSIIRERQTIVDLSTGLNPSDFAHEASMRGARYLDPTLVFAEQLKITFQLLTGTSLPEAAFQKALSE